MLTTATGILVIALGLICWVGQTLVVFAPTVAVKLGVGEREQELDRSMYLFERFSQGVPDILLTWILPAAALMMILGVEQWPLFALVGGGVYLYFPAVFIITRIALKKDGKKIGRPSSVFAAYSLGVLWMISAAYMIFLAVEELGGGASALKSG